MNAVALMQQLQRGGFRVSVDGADLVIGPANLLTDSLRAAIRSNKLALLDLIAGGYPACGICPRCQRFVWRPVHSPSIGWQCVPCRDRARTTSQAMVSGAQASGA